MTLPLLMIYFPVVGIAIGSVYGLQHLTVWTESSLMICTAHSILDSLVIIFGIRPYRIAVLRFFRKSVHTTDTSIYRSKNSITPMFREPMRPRRTLHFNKIVF
ncbi:hypothetical protein M3Y94_01183600 [Aphelenchoides besseyi]|nr:hypothetical protein M3Y94_01183600 [Aphelenchoides besseyi]